MLVIVVLFVIVGLDQSALPVRANLTSILFRQCLYRGGGYRHGPGHHLRPYRRLGRLADRRARHDCGTRSPSRAIRSGSPGPCRSLLGIVITMVSACSSPIMRVPSIVVTLGMLVDPQRRPDQRHRRHLDLRHAA